MRESEAWIVQVKSDFATAEKLFDETQTSLYCQAIAKYQQVVEKSVKAMVASVKDAGVPINPVTRSHSLTREVQSLKLLRRADNASTEAIARLFAQYQTAIEDVSKLAPAWPQPGQLFSRNTEYPFEVAGGWSAPAEAGVFSWAEVKEVRETAWIIHRRAMKFAQAVRLARR